MFSDATLVLLELPCWPKYVYWNYPASRHLLGSCGTFGLESALGTVARIRCGVGRGNKFVLLDMTEEPEAKKTYSIQHKRNLMER